MVTIFLHCARPGMVIGKGGEQIEQYRLAIEKLVGKKVRLNIVEVRNPDMNAQLVAENIAQQLEKRISHRRAMKNAADKLHGQLNAILNSNRAYLQDAVITMRDGRYCLPVKSEYKNQVAGMVHDQSATGATLFIEPRP